MIDLFAEILEYSYAVYLVAERVLVNIVHPQPAEKRAIQRVQ